MINHMRTLLFNKTADSFVQHSILYHRTDPSLQYLLGELYIPPEFRTVEVPAVLSPVYDALVPRTSTRVQRNYSIGSLMDLVHTADLDKYVRKHDARITYIPGDIRYRRMFDLDVRVSRFGSYDCRMYYLKLGDWSQFPLNGDMFTWSISPSKGKVTVQDYKGKTLVGDLRFNSAGVSSKVVLVPGFLEIYFHSPSGIIDSNKEKFTLGITNIEPFDIASTVESLRFELGRSAKAAQQLFTGRDTEMDDINLFKALWDNYPDMAYQLAGITLALGYKLNELS